jgi:uncharacterized protein YciI
MDAPFHAVFFQVDYSSLEEVPQEPLEEHVARSRRWHAERRLLMAGAFLDRVGEPIQTMAVLRTQDDAEEFAAGDPFVVAGTARVTAIRPWADILDLA